MMNLTPVSTASGMSLFEELSSMNHTLMPEEFSSTYDSCEVGAFILLIVYRLTFITVHDAKHIYSCSGA